MDALKARVLLNRLEQRDDHRLTKAIPLDANARRLLDVLPNQSLEGRDDKAVVELLGSDRLAWDEKTKSLVGTASAINIDEKVRPSDNSPQFTTGVEQCMEFVIRYFKTERHKDLKWDTGFASDWKTQNNIADDVRCMANGTLPRPGYTAYLNGGEVPPRAGDILSLESSSDYKALQPEFHVCIVSAVSQRNGQWFARVYEANVPYGVNDPDIKKHYEEIPLTLRDGKFTLERVNTKAKGYDSDMDVVGWIHPLPAKALAGAVSTAVKPAAPLPFGLDQFIKR